MEKFGVDLIEADQNHSIRHALFRSYQFLANPTRVSSEDETHQIKSILYAVVERLRARSERLVSIQQKFREVLFLLMCAHDLTDAERLRALALIQEIEHKYFT